MRSRLLLRAGLRFFLRKPWQSGLAVLGVATGVAAVAGINLASASAERAFALSVESIAGPATHEIVGGPSGIDETWYAALERSPGLPLLLPIVEGWIRLEGLDRPVRLLGLDLFAGASVSHGAATGVDAGALLLRPGAALVGARLRAELAARAENHALGWAEDEREEKVGDRINLALPAGLDALWLIGTLEASNGRQEEAMGRLVVVDISTAQELLGRLGRLDRVEVVLDPAPAAAGARRDQANPRNASATLARLRALLPPQAVLQAKSARAGALEEMTFAFRLNLRALSMLALLVGAFLIYSTVSFAVVQRRQLIGLVRALGTSRRQVAALVLTEAMVIGSLGTVLGLAAGTLLARGLLILMVQTINDLYFAFEVERVAWLGTPLLLSAALGLVTSLLAAAIPAWEAANAPPRRAQIRSQPETRMRQRAPWIAGFGLVLMAVAAAWVMLVPRGLFAGFAAVFLTVTGAACLVPAATALAMHAATPLLRRGFGSLGALAARGVVATLSRTGIALAALVVAVATATGVGVMVHSFRATVIDWLDVTLQADVYVSTLRGGRGTRPSLSPAVVSALRSTRGVAHISTYRRVEVGSPEGPVQVVAVAMTEAAFRIFRFAEAKGKDQRRQIYRALHDSESVMISTPLAYRLDRSPGDPITLNTEQGPRAFTIAGVYDDFASDRGTIHLARALYDRFYTDQSIDSLGIFALPDVAPETLRTNLETRLEGLEDSAWVNVVSNRAIRDLSLEIFDRTFRVTQVLRLLAVVIAFVGVLASLMALELERGRERAILRALGLEPRQLRWLVTAQTALLGLCAGVFAAPLGVALSWLLVHVINRRAFGWTLHLAIPPWMLIQGVLLAMAAALLAGWWPARRMARALPAEALRDE